MQQQPGQQNQQPVYNEPPKVMSTKDHLYINDMLSWNLLAMKKMSFYASQCQDQDVINLLNQAGQMHQRHYQSLMQQLQQLANQPLVGMNPEMGQLGQGQQQQMMNPQNMGQ
jgi:hypothetical protein